jgi:enediyne biosynthesis protein E4
VPEFSAIFDCKGAAILNLNRFHKYLRPITGPIGHRGAVAALLGATSVLPAVTPQSPAGGPTAGGPRYVNVAGAAGLTFIHRHSPTPDKQYPESVPGGVAVFDYNGDGRFDIFLTNGAEMPALRKNGDAYANRLYRNDGGMKFTDVTGAAGVAGVGYAMGAAAADYDNDGHVDLFVAGVARNQLLRNRGDGTFEDVTDRAHIGSGEWAAAGGWFDYDNDSRLDLLVINYVRWSAQGGRFCGDQARGVRIYCHPRYFEGLANRLYRNRGDGTFEDVSAQSGIARHVGKGMSVAVADYDHDGDIDAFVTNDTVPNFLFRNNGDGTFAETALPAGVAVPESGRPISGMGVDFQDYDNDGWEDLHLTGISSETFPLFRNDSRTRAGTFVEATASSGLGRLSARLSGWCTVFIDADNDGAKDLFTANSHPNDRIERSEATEWQQANSLFMNDGRGRFRDATGESGFGEAVAVHRGCGVADFDADGRSDIVVLVLGGQPELWHNESKSNNGWLTVRLTGTRTNRDGIGARVTVNDQVRIMTTAVGYASSSHAGVHFGLGSTAALVTVRVEWPSGVKQVVEKVEPNRVVEIKEQQ